LFIIKSVIQTRIRIAFIPIMLVVFLFTGCSTLEELPLTGDAWRQADLRALELPGPVIPEQDLIAVYARETSSDLELRFDLLGSPDPGEYELIVFLDGEPGGSTRYPWGDAAGLEWDLVIHYPGRGLPRASGRGRSALEPGSPQRA